LLELTRAIDPILRATSGLIPWRTNEKKKSKSH
jgi:hypothetical protein